ncbi:hypothetical protein [Streptomyces longisporus]|uniref:Transposase n=1 Tax=Streptomyces longisporus TaxID=1948 RepID=A0ABN3LKB4_STRLO
MVADRAHGHAREVPKSQTHDARRLSRKERSAAENEGGRGLPLVAQPTQRWGTRHTTMGKTIWAEQSIEHS